jgi:RNA polymerase sigma-70 factor (ECF subfamily)
MKFASTLWVGAQGMSYEEAASVCRVVVGTVKSRVNRARSKLALFLDLTSDAELGPDDVTKAALAADQV